MPTAENARLEYEAGQTLFPMGALTDSGDHKKFTSGASIWSGKAGSEADVRPDGLISGGVVSAAASGGNDVIDVAASTCYIGGIKLSIAASTDVAVTRAATLTHQISSVTLTSGGAIAVVAGTEGSAFSETRGAAGGPPEVPAGNIEIGQVRLSSGSAAPVSDTEIFQVVGFHQERFDFPLWDVKPESGSIEFISALPTIHASAAIKGVQASYSEPIFSEVSLASDFVPPETSHSVSSTQIYSKTLGSTSKSLNQGSFTAFLNDGIADNLVKLKDEILWFKFFQDRFKASHILCQGNLGIARTFPAGADTQAACTISAAVAAIEVVA